MADSLTTPEELALALSQATFAAQRETEVKLRERATSVLSAASVVVPVAAVALSKGSSAAAAFAFALAGVAYIFCARACCRALFPKGFATGIAGARFLETAAQSEADLRQMQATASAYFDAMHESNLPTLEMAADDVRNAINWLMAEIVLSAVALVVTLS
jgi:hypothetical protein